MAVLYVDSSALVSGTTSINVAYTSTVNLNDILVLIISNNSSTLPPLPSGWASIATNTDAAAGDELAYRVCYKRALGTESGTVTVTGLTNTYGIMHRFSGIITSGNPFHNSGSGLSIWTSVRSSLFTTRSGVANDLKVAFMIAKKATSMTDASAADWTVRSNVVSTTGSGCAMFLVTSADITNTQAKANLSPSSWGGLSSIAFEWDGTALAYTQEGFRFRNDDGSESTATWKAAQDINITQAKNITARLRTLIDTAGDAPTDQITLQYKRTDEASGEWRNV